MALVFQAELVKLMSRLSARVGLVLAFLLGVIPPLLTFLFVSQDPMVNGAAAQSFEIDPTQILIAALYIRSFPVVMRAFLIILAAQSLAGEFGARTLREDLLRPVTRHGVFFAKFGALLVWDAFALLLTFVPCALIGLLAFGTGGPWLAVILAYALAVVCDAGVIAVVFAIGALTRSTVATITGMLVFLVLDKMLGLAMPLASTVATLFTTSEFIIDLLNQWPILPSAAFGVWTFVLPDAEFMMISTCSLALITDASLLTALVALRRLDVP